MTGMARVKATVTLDRDKVEEARVSKAKSDIQAIETSVGILAISRMAEISRCFGLLMSVES